jgi:hypothetical protein
MLLYSLNKLKIFIPLLAIIFISCKKEQAPTEISETNDCLVQTNRIYHSMAPLISTSDSILVQSLFQKNNLSLLNIQVWFLSKDVYFVGDHYVFCDQYYHGMHIFPSEVIFWFNDQDILYNTVGELIDRITIDTIPRVTTDSAGILFCHAIATDSLFKNSLSSFRSYGFNAELKINNLDYDKESIPKRFLLVWYLTVANGSKYPAGCVRADSLSLLYYDNGYHPR